MVRRSNQGQSLMETLILMIFFSGVFVSLKYLMVQHRSYSKKSTFIKEVYHELQTTNR